MLTRGNNEDLEKHCQSEKIEIHSQKTCLYLILPFISFSGDPITSGQMRHQCLHPVVYLHTWVSREGL